MNVKRTIDIASSLMTGIAGLFTLTLLMAVGSIAMLGTGAYESINTMPLFKWINKVSLKDSWWLVLSLVTLSIITANTILCTVRSLIAKTPARSFLLKISPQIMHAGFLLILLAHLFSSYDSFHYVTRIYEGQGIQMSNSTIARFTEIRLLTDKTGFPTGMTAKVTVTEGEDRVLVKKISPNHPAFYNNMGIYLKNVLPYRFPAAMVEISSDSGAIWAFAGGILFFTGNILLVVLKWRHELSSSSLN
ncbi:MAG: cytochrome C biogenesis protein ResB [Nitrospirota bacterium]|nr:MAG: cytochrome C biogenesis protein ResB [Nitrospirota bacterium]